MSTFIRMAGMPGACLERMKVSRPACRGADRTDVTEAKLTEGQIYSRDGLLRSRSRLSYSRATRIASITVMSRIGAAGSGISRSKK